MPPSRAGHSGRLRCGPEALAEAADSAALYPQADLVQLVDELVGLSHEEGTPNTYRHIWPI